MVNRFAEYSNEELRGGVERIIDFTATLSYKYGAEYGFFEGLKKGTRTGLLVGLATGILITSSVFIGIDKYNNMQEENHNPVRLSTTNLEGDLEWKYTRRKNQ